MVPLFGAAEKKGKTVPEDQEGGKKKKKKKKRTGIMRSKKSKLGKKEWGEHAPTCLLRRKGKEKGGVFTPRFGQKKKRKNP